MTASSRAPRVTVICPTYNRSEAIVRTLDSVRAQSFSDWEMLVVSDGSTDDTDEWVREAADEDPRIRLVRAGRHGHPSGPRTIGLAEARGEIAAYLDHDDRWRPDHLAVVLDAFDKGADVVATACERRDSAGRLVSRSGILELCWHPQIQLLGPVFEPSRVAHRLPLAAAAGGWRTGIGLEDWDLWLRMADTGLRFTTLDEHTAVLLDDSGTRRHRTARRHRLTLAVFDDAREARRVLEEVRSERYEAASREAYLRDNIAWYQQMSLTPEFVTPQGWAGDVRPELERLAAAPDLVLWPDLVVVPEGRRFAVAQMQWCSTPEHAARITELVAEVQREQLGLVTRIAEGRC
ncbi:MULTISPECIES: glycosyltransferase family 2 protein [unclassified Streptomyces]|uniref:glycosyltransferase family 2 protein n=1 Tax=unclassified Streptomyces TaxID=2593676 RepID=UPI0016601E81|nr:MULTISPECIES: glycosyltransferase family 2 protein [unclassified Streptomyces]MBD0706873.1 glycosyl transferase [Streptomyces sp. CBMA291]MBD0715009.1 glycosyl transferase [Streptomyces sp. CBMA370]